MNTATAKLTTVELVASLARFRESAQRFREAGKSAQADFAARIASSLEAELEARHGN